MGVNSPIGHVVEILEGDVEAVIHFSCKLVDFLQAEPHFTWSQFLFSFMLMFLLNIRR